MKNNYKLLLIIIIMVFSTNFNNLFSQATHTGTYRTGTDFLGFNSGTAGSLDIRNDFLSPSYSIRFFTYGLRRASITMKGDFNVVQPTNGYMIDSFYVLRHNGVGTRLYVGVLAGNSTAIGTFNTCVGYGSGNSLTSGNNNTFTGTTAGFSNQDGINNSAYGYRALYYNVSGNANTAFGNSALQNSTANNNSAFGYSALAANVQGTENVGCGTNALFSNTDGKYNTAVGTNAMYYNALGGEGTAVGYHSMYYATISGFNQNVAFGAYALQGTAYYTGNANTAIGYKTLLHNSNGSSNTANGYASMPYNTNGSFNTANGSSSLFNNSTGSYNTGIGAGTLNSLTTEYYNTAIGYLADVKPTSSMASAIGCFSTVQGSDIIRIGTDITTVFVHQNDVLPSDGRFKFNVQNNVVGLDFIMKLRPVTYQMNTEALDHFESKYQSDSIRAIRYAAMDFTASTAKVHSGFIAQEVDSVAKASGSSSSIVYVPNDTSEQTYGLAYAEFVVPLVKAVQELDLKSGKDFDFMLAGSGNNPANAADIDSIKSTNGYLEINKSNINPAAVLDVQNKSSIANFKNTGAGLFNTDATGFAIPEDTNYTGIPKFVNLESDIINLPEENTGVVGIKSNITSSDGNVNNYAIWGNVEGYCEQHAGINGTAKDANANFGFLGSAESNQSGNSAYGVCASAYTNSQECNESANWGVFAIAGNGVSNIGGYFQSSTNMPQCNETNYACNIGVDANAYGGYLNYGIYSSASALGSNNYSVSGYFDGDIDGIGNFYYASDQKFKLNTQNIVNPISIISQLHPKSYTFNKPAFPFMNFNAGNQVGFLANDVQSVLPYLVKKSVFPAKYDSLHNMIHDTVQYKSVNYIGLIPIIVAGIQQEKMKGDSVSHSLKTTIDSLKTTIDSLKQVISTYGARFNALEQMINTCCHTNPGGNRTHQNSTDSTKVTEVYLANFQEVVLNQNQPNPFSENTLVTYFIPENIKFAQMIFSDNFGKILKTVDITTSGDGAIKVYAANLSSGLYTYSLVIDGKVVESKKMICTK